MISNGRKKKKELLEGSGYFPTPHPEAPFDYAQGKLRAEGSIEILRFAQDDPFIRRKNSPRGQLLKNISVSVVSLVLFFSAGEFVTRLTAGSPLVTQSDEVLFWKYKKNQVGCQKLYSPISRVDKNGFRYSGKEFNPELPSIYVGGDSYAWGEGLLDTETFAAHLQALLDSRQIYYNVLNGGVPGYGITQIIDRMEMECENYQPRYALFLWMEGDLDRLRGLSLERKKRFLRDHKLRSMFRYSAFLKIIKEWIFDKMLQKDLGFGYYGDENLEYARTHTFKEKVEGLTPRIKSNVTFLKDRGIIPIWSFMTVPSREFKSYLTSLSSELSVTLIDPEPTYREHFPGLENMATRHSGHFKPEVYSLLADQVFSKAFNQ